MPILSERAVVFHGLKITWPRLLAVCRTHLALMEGRNQLVLLNLAEGQSLKIQALQTLPFGPKKIRVTDEGRHVLLISGHGNYAAVWSTEKSRLVLELAGPDGLAATLTQIDGEDVLVASRHPSQIEAWALPSAKPLFSARVSAAPFIIQQIVHSGDYWRMIGHRYLEIDDLLISIPDAELKNAAEHQPVALIAAPRMVLDETAVGDVYFMAQDDLGQHSYLRQLAGDQVIEVGPQIPIHGLVTQIFGRWETVGIVTDEKLELWDRVNQTKELSMGIRTAAFDPQAQVAAVVTQAGKVRLLSLK